MEAGAIPRPRLHYGFVVVALTFAALLATAGLRSTPGVLMLPLGNAFGWSRATVSLAAATGILLYGLTGPFAAAAMQSFGIRRTLLASLTVMAAATGASALMTRPWHLFVSWGVVTGVASGAVASVLGATVVNRWFATNRGLMMGLLSASTATGTMIFLPGLASIAEAAGWRAVVLTVAGVMAALVPVAYFLLPEHPRDRGLEPYGAVPGAEVAAARSANPLATAFGALRTASASPAFWFLFGTFFVCGATTNGLVGTHMIALCADHGMTAVHAAGVLAMMGVFDLIGTTGSGWLSDRVDPRRLLFVYYTIRGAALIYLPFSDFSTTSLTVFAVLYGLDWLATVPPTLQIANESFGERDAPIVFGWIMAGHQMGAATAALGAGMMRASQGSYVAAFVAAGIVAMGAAIASLGVKRAPALA